MTGAARRQSNWTADEDQRLLKLVEAGKSWVFISANLKRPASSARGRLAYLLRQGIKAEFDSGTCRAKAKGESQMSPSRPARRSWTADEGKKLNDLLRAGKDAGQIATALQRTRVAIYARLQRHDIKRKKAARRLGLKAKGK